MIEKSITWTTTTRQAYLVTQAIDEGTEKTFSKKVQRDTAGTNDHKGFIGCLKGCMDYLEVLAIDIYICKQKVSRMSASHVQYLRV